MFTSRAEYRLHLRIDNADERLTPIGKRAGLVTEGRWNAYLTKQEQKQRLRQYAGKQKHSSGVLLADWARRPESRLSDLPQLDEEFDPQVLQSVETELKYAGYLVQQRRQVERLEAAETRRIPASFVYVGVPGLSNEVREKLDRVRPETLGQAARIPGVTPAAVAVLEVYLRLSA
jgi:tRNA uridine 5-carboxymethylaminomethyl modification enzyme